MSNSKFSQKLAEKTAGIDPTRPAAARRPGTAGTSAGGLLAQMQVSERYESQLQDLTEQINALKASRTTSKAHLSELHSRPERKRKLTVEQKLELRANLAKCGLIEPFIVEPRAEGGYWIISGNNRHEELHQIERELAKTSPDTFEPQSYDIIIKNPGDERQANVWAFFSNLFHPELPDYEKYHGFVKLMSDTGLTQADLEQESGLSKSSISRILSFDRLPVPLKGALSENPHAMTASCASALLAAAGGNDQVLTEFGRELIVGNMTQDQAVKAIRARLAPARATTKTPEITIKHGRHNVARVTARADVVAVQFKALAGLDIEQWQKRIADWLDAEIRKTEANDAEGVNP